MKGVEEIKFRKKVIAMVFRDDLPVAGVAFFTGPDNPFQVGAHSRPKGTKVTPHIHAIEKPLTIRTIQEILFVKKGKIRLTMYDEQGKNIRKKILGAGDSVLLMDMGHGIEFLSDAQIFEVKQGPYPGVKHAKIYLHP